MKGWLAGRHRKLFFRSYFMLAGGLLLVAVVLDLGFDALQQRQAHRDDPWLESTFRLMETALAAAPPVERASVAADLGKRLGLQVRLLDKDEIAAASTITTDLQTLEDSNANTYYMRHSEALGTAIRFGPLRPPPENPYFRYLPAVFYLSILVIVGLWLRPLFRDLGVLTEASQKFSADYRQPLDTAARTTQLTSLAGHLDAMSGRISHLIQSQKELTSALSHEMRTPLARIRFALAVIGNQTDTAVRSQLRDINLDVQQIDDLIANMLHYARLDHPGTQMEWRDTPVDAWLRQVLAACGGRERAVEIVRAEGFETAWMEPRLMELAVSNLVVNAMRYAQQRVRVTIGPTPAGYRIAVEDDGEGIPESEREAIFKAFTRLDSSRNRGTGGFGLGLAIVARIAALHRGRAAAGRSEALRGAQLVVEWPRPEMS